MCNNTSTNHELAALARAEKIIARWEALSPSDEFTPCWSREKHEMSVFRDDTFNGEYCPEEVLCVSGSDWSDVCRTLDAIYTALYFESKLRTTRKD